MVSLLFLRSTFWWIRCTVCLVLQDTAATRTSTTRSLRRGRTAVSTTVSVRTLTPDSTRAPTCEYILLLFHSIYLYISIYLSIYLSTYIYTNIHTHTNTYICLRMHAHITHTHKHTHISRMYQQILTSNTVTRRETSRLLMRIDLETTWHQLV